MPTPNLGLTLPVVNGDNGIWGNELNTDLTIIDGLGVIPNQNFAANGTLAYDTGGRPIVVSECSAGAGGITVTLPASTLGKVFVLVKTDSGVGSVTVATSSSQTISGQSTMILSNQWQYLGVFGDGSNWIVVFGSGL